jgi:hypothetical protein
MCGDMTPEELSVLRLEVQLLEPSVRHDHELVAALLDDDFVEFGSSGRRWDKASVVAGLPLEPVGNEPIEIADEHASTLAEDVILVTYRSRGALRSSLWRRGRDGTWRLRFHQGTPS